jgi:hypothetical protein
MPACAADQGGGAHGVLLHPRISRLTKTRVSLPLPVCGLQAGLRELAQLPNLATLAVIECAAAGDKATCQQMLNEVAEGGGLAPAAAVPGAAGLGGLPSPASPASEDGQPPTTPAAAAARRSALPAAAADARAVGEGAAGAVPIEAAGAAADGQGDAMDSQESGRGRRDRRDGDRGCDREVELEFEARMLSLPTLAEDFTSTSH